MTFVMPPIAVTPEIEAALRAGAVVAFGVSSGKDSTAQVLGTNAYLDSIGHPRELRVLIHADLGVIEWAATPLMAERLSEFVGLPLLTVRRGAGDMLDRWRTRWKNNVARYQSLSCVTLITPWSTPAMRFCTSELKVSPITAELKRQFPGRVILSASGIRAEESANRAKAPVAKAQPKLTGVTAGTSGMDWHPILRWTLDDVLAIHEHYGFPLHEAYTTFGSSRLSCSFCIMARGQDHLAALRDERNHPAFHQIVALEVASTFSFQAAHWVADRGAHLLDDATRAAVVDAKRRADGRRALEVEIPEDLLYTKGWPERVPTAAEAELLARVRTGVGALMGLDCDFTTAERIRERYADLMEQKAAKDLKARRGEAVDADEADLGLEVVGAGTLAGRGPEQLSLLDFAGF